MINIAILGYGTVGSGVFDVMSNAKGVNIKYVLDLRDFPNTLVQEKIVHDYDTILNDDTVKIVVEVMGGTEPAYTYAKKALIKGKSVITSNKALVAEHGAELLSIAKEKNTNFLFEASVGGGIPIIRAMHTSLAADTVYEITGILNGTSNYVLTKMALQDKEFDEALKMAQEKGYAERNPADDIEGWDTCRKISILLSLVVKKRVNFEDIYTEGIKNITKTDIGYAEKLDCTIKLLAEGRIDENGVSARVSPVILTKSHPLGTVNNVYNAVFVQGRAVGELMFYGKGAGKLTTASAVAADIMDAANHIGINLGYFWADVKADILPVQDEQTRELVRIAFRTEEAIAFACELFKTNEIIYPDNASDEFALLTNTEKKNELDKKIEILKQKDFVTEIRNVIRVEL